jgi:hypothetical protein
VLLAACGADDDDSATATPPASTATSAASVAVRSAQSLLPKLDDAGFKLVDQQKEPGLPPNIDSVAAIYRGENLMQQIQVRIRIEPDAATAKKEFDQFAVLLKNPPKEFLGIEAKFIEADSPPLGEERKSFRTAQADGRGYSAWTDLYLKGRTVVLIQVVDNSPDGQPLRQHAGSRSLQSAP